MPSSLARRAPIRGYLKLAILALSGGPLAHTVLLAQAILFLPGDEIGRARIAIARASGLRGRREHDAALGGSGQVSNGGRDTTRLRKSTARRQTVALSLSQALGGASLAPRRGSVLHVGLGLSLHCPGSDGNLGGRQDSAPPSGFPLLLPSMHGGWFWRWEILGGGGWEGKNRELYAWYTGRRRGKDGRNE
jgi:hypothetical protein